MNRRTVLTLVFSLLIITVFLTAYFLSKTTEARTTIYVDPDRVSESIGHYFIVNISISNVMDLYAWEIKLGWNSTVLGLVNVTEGLFLKETGLTFFSHKLNETFGHAVIDCTLLGNVAGVNGTGVLASTQFFVKSKGTCEIDLFDTKLVSVSERMITHTVNDGEFSIQQ